MNTTTSAHIDPSTLRTTAGSEDLNLRQDAYNQQKTDLNSYGQGGYGQRGYTSEQLDSARSDLRYSAQSAQNAGHDTAQAAQSAAYDTTRSAQSAVHKTAQSAQSAVQDTAQSAQTSARNTAQSARSAADSTAHSISANLPTATGIRQRVNKIGGQLDQASEHPAVKNAKGVAQSQIAQFREMLGQSSLVRDVEARTGVDRVLLVVGGTLAYLLLIPLNLFGLALPTTNLLSFLPPTLLAVNILDRSSSTANEDETKALLAYYIVLGFVQFIESLASGVLARRIPQYYTLKLVFLAYLAHPKTHGALRVHEQVFRPLLARASAPTSNANTPPTSKPSTSSASSPNPFTNRMNDSSQMGGSIAPGSTVHLPSGGGSGVGLDTN